MCYRPEQLMQREECGNLENNRLRMNEMLSLRTASLIPGLNPSSFGATFDVSDAKSTYLSNDTYTILPVM